MSLTAQQRSARARIGGFAFHALHDSGQAMARARAGLVRREIEQLLDPAGLLEPGERARRAEAALKAIAARAEFESLKAADPAAVQ